MLLFYFIVSFLLVLVSAPYSWQLKIPRLYAYCLTPSMCKSSPTQLLEVGFPSPVWGTHMKTLNNG